MNAGTREPASRAGRKRAPDTMPHVERPRAGGALVPAVAGIAALAVYLVTLHPSLPAGDSGELIAAAACNGVAHPPGYPLYVMLGHLWMKLVPLGSPAWRMNLLSALLGAATVALVAATVRRLTRSSVASIAAGLFLAGSAPFWKYAVVAEVFVPNALLAALMIAALVSLLERSGRLAPPATASHGSTTVPLATLALLTTLALSHHHTLLLLALPVDAAALWLVLGREHAARARPPAVRGAWATAIAAALLGLLPLIHLPLAAARHPPLDWGHPASFPAFLRVLTRGDYGTFRLDPRAAGLVADRSHVLLYLQSLTRDFTLPGVILLTIGMVVMLRRRRPLFAALAGFLLLQILFFTRIGFPSLPIYRGVVERFYVLPDTVLAIALGVGAAAVLGRLPARIRPAGVAALLLVALAPLVFHWRTVDQRGNTFTEDLARNVLASLPARAVLFARGDLFHNGVAYLTVAAGERPDVTLIDQELLTYPWYAPELRRRAPDVLPRLGAEDRYRGTAETGTLRWLDHLAGRRPVALIGLQDSTFAERWELIPEGFVLHAYPRGAAPPIGERADSALALMERVRFDAYFRRYDPWSFETESRWRLAVLAVRPALLLCDPQSAGLAPAEHPGFARLEAFIARHRRLPDPEPALLRAGGLLHALNPHVHDPEAARQDLERYLATAPQGRDADEARRVLEWLARVEEARPPAATTLTR